MPMAHTPLLRILLVEDNYLAQLAIQWLLETMHCHVTTAFTGEEALILFKQHGFDLVFLDVGLPDCSGYEVSLAMRHWEKIQGLLIIPIIALSTQVNREIKQRCLMSGMQAVVIKPLKKKIVRDMLTEFLQGMTAVHREEWLDA